MKGPEAHASAIVHPDARIGDGTLIGAYSVIGAGVTLGSRCQVLSHVVIDGDTVVGDSCRFFPFSSIGLVPQDLKYRGEPTRLRIGAENTFRECATVHSGTEGGGGVTTIGDRNLFMAYTHIAHDCHVGNDTIFANAATLAGHVRVEDFAAIGAFSGIHQFCRIGAHAYIGGYSVITQDALPYVLTVGNRARAYGINVIGLKRRSFAESTIASLRRAYRILFQSKLTTLRALERMEKELDGFPEVAYLAAFVRSSERGIVK